MDRALEIRLECILTFRASERERGHELMQLLVVRYARERGQEDAEQAAGNLAAAPVIAELEGLAWKVWPRSRG